MLLICFLNKTNCYSYSSLFTLINCNGRYNFAYPTYPSNNQKIMKGKWGKQGKQNQLFSIIRLSA